MESQKFCLKWNNFQSSVTSVFDSLRHDEELVDITLCCEGKKIKAHRMMLSACSPYFRDLLKENPCQHPVFFLKDTSYDDIRAVIEFVYKGEVNVAQCQLPSFLKTAEMLQVRGLTGDDEEETAASKQTGASGHVPSHRTEPPAESHPVASSSHPACPPSSLSPPPSKRSRLSEPPSAVESACVSEPVDEPVACVEPLLGSGPSMLPEQRPPADGPIKVEKVDLVDSDDNSLDASLSASQMAAFEAMQSEGGDHTFDPHDHQLSGLLSTSVEPGSSMADMSSRTAGTSDENSQGAAALSTGYLRVCELCNKPLYSMSSFTCHMSMHRGYTSCPVCGRVLSSRQRLLHHYRSQHVHPASGRLPGPGKHSAEFATPPSSDQHQPTPQSDQFDLPVLDSSM